MFSTVCDVCQVFSGLGLISYHVTLFFLTTNLKGRRVFFILLEMRVKLRKVK